MFKLVRVKFCHCKHRRADHILEKPELHFYSDGSHEVMAQNVESRSVVQNHLVSFFGLLATNKIVAQAIQMRFSQFLKWKWSSTIITEINDKRPDFQEQPLFQELAGDVMLLYCNRRTSRKIKSKNAPD